MTEFADLEIGLHRRDIGAYAVEFRYSQPGSEAEVRLDQSQPAHIALDPEELAKLEYDPDAYGRRLTQFFFADQRVEAAFAQARANAQSQGAPMRLRLIIGSSAPELNGIVWEMLRDPQDGSPLSTNENVLFSRYLSSMDWRPIRLRAKGELHALVVVANPSDLAEYNLAPIDVQGEVKRARTGLADIRVTVLSPPGSEARSTLNNLFDSLRTEEVDVLYFVCHGAMVKEEPWMWLEDDHGRAARASGIELVTRLKELQARPRLVVLASCESAGAGTGAALSALGPRLAEAGIPAVLAMQGKISVQTVTEFMPVFFRELERDGQIDRAVAVARSAVRQRPDHWMPALFMRLKSGRIWYVPGFGDERDVFEKWQSLAGFIHDKTCTPILGPGLNEPILGSNRDMAMRWAEKHGFPLAPQDRDVLPRVAQYIITRQSSAYLTVAYREAVRDEIMARFEDILPDELRQANSWYRTDLARALDVVTTQVWEDNPEHPYRLLAQLRLPLYITASTLDFMSRALVEAGAEPVVRICPWNKWIPREKVIYEETPTPERPLVYHLFGHQSVPNSFVYAEDRYFDYLIGVTLNRDLIPTAVRAALNSTSLLFLGLQMDDWEFRVFFRFLVAQAGRELLKFYTHAAAQIEPEEERIVDVNRARKYLEEYFEGENIAIYWGKSEEFLKALKQHL